MTESLAACDAPRLTNLKLAKQWRGWRFAYPSIWDATRGALFGDLSNDDRARARSDDGFKCGDLANFRLRGADAVAVMEANQLIILFFLLPLLSCLRNNPF